MKKTRKEIDYEILEIMRDELDLSISSVPVVAVLIEIESGRIIDFSTNDPIGNGKISNSHNHAEQKLLLSTKTNLDKDYRMVVNIPPCNKCMVKMHESKLNIKEVEYISNYQLTKKLNDLKNEQSIVETDLSFTLKPFNHNGYQDQQNLVREIVKHYKEYQVRTLLYIWYKVNFENEKQKYMYVGPEEYSRFKTFFLIINDVDKGNRRPAFKIRGGNYKIRVSELVKFIHNTPKEILIKAEKNFNSTKDFRKKIMIMNSIRPRGDKLH